MQDQNQYGLSPNYERRPLTRPAGARWRDTLALRGADAQRIEPQPSLLQLLLRRKKIIVLSFLGGALLAAGLGSLMKPRYEGHVALEAQGVNGNVLNSQELDPTAVSDTVSQPFIATQARILQSTPVINRAIESVRSDKAFRNNEEAKNLTEDVAEASVRVKNGEIDRVLDLTYVAHDPRLAAAMANAIAQAAITEDLQSHWQAAQRTSDWLEQQLKALRKKVTDSEAALAAYTQQVGLLFSADDRGEVSEAQLHGLQEELARAQSDLVTSESADEQMRIAAPGSPGFTATDNVLEGYQTRLTELQREHAQLTAVYAPDYYKVKQNEHEITALEAAIEQRQNAIARRTHSEYSRAQRRQALLSTAYNNAAKTVIDQESKSVQYNLLKRQAETDRQIYDAMLQKVSSYDIASAMRASNLRVIDPAEAPAFPSQPNIPLLAVLGAIGGLFGSVVWAFISGHSDRSIRQPGDTRRVLCLPELGVIPSAKIEPRNGVAGKRHPSLAGANGNGHHNGSLPSLEIVTGRGGVSSVLAESFRSAHASLLLGNEGSKMAKSAVIVVSSLKPGEGKTTLASNLAIVRAEYSGRVLLIDADRKRPRLHTVFGCDGSFGLGDLLTNERPIEDYAIDELAQPTWIPRLSVLPRGSCLHEVPHRIYSGRMMTLLSRLRSEYETIIIDTPPLIHLSDARLLARLSDGLVLVFRAGKSQSDEALLMQQRLADDGVNILGCILNDWDPKTTGSTYMSDAKRYAASSAG